MTVALCSTWFPAGTSLDAAALGLRHLGLDRLHLVLPGPVAAGAHDALRSHGVVATSVGQAVTDPGASDPAFETSAAPVVRAASRLRAGRVVFEGGHLATGRARGPASLEGDLGHREGTRTEAAERAVRALHALQTDGVPLALRPGGQADDLLHFEETGWLLDELPTCTVFLDTVRATRLSRLGLGPELEQWVETYAHRTSGVFAHGMGSDGRGCAHPEDDGCAWRALGDALPRAAPWVLDLEASLSGSDVQDALRYLAAHR